MVKIDPFLGHPVRLLYREGIKEQLSVKDCYS